MGAKHWYDVEESEEEDDETWLQPDLLVEVEGDEEETTVLDPEFDEECVHE